MEKVITLVSDKKISARNILYVVRQKIKIQFSSPENRKKSNLALYLYFVKIKF